jgi:PhnB protein
MTTLNPYLFFTGNTEEVFNFYKLVFGGEFSALSRYTDAGENSNIPANYNEKIMHIALPVGNNILMGSDAVVQAGQTFKVGDNMTVSIACDSLDEANRLYNGLSEAGKIEMPMQKMFWGAWFAMFTDKFGTQWMVNYDDNQPQN